MKKVVSIILGTLVLLTGGIFVSLNVGDEILTSDIKQVDFEQVVIQIQDLQMATTTDDSGKVVNIGVKIPIKYNFPKLTDGVYEVVEVEEYVKMNFGAYNTCRFLGGSTQKCGQELKDDMISNVETRRLNIQKELEELKAQVFQDEVVVDNL